MKASARSISRASASYRSPNLEVRTKSRFQSCTACRSARPPPTYARSMFIDEDELAYARIIRCGSATRASSRRHQRVDHVAAVRRQAQRVERLRAGLGVLAGHPGDLHHRQAGAVGQHDRHLQQRARVGEQVRLGVVGERLGAVAALQQERPPLAHVGQARPAGRRPRTARPPTARCSGRSRPRRPRPGPAMAGSAPGAACANGPAQAPRPRRVSTGRASDLEPGIAELDATPGAWRQPTVAAHRWLSAGDRRATGTRRLIVVGQLMRIATTARSTTRHLAICTPGRARWHPASVVAGVTRWFDTRVRA